MASRLRAVVIVAPGVGLFVGFNRVQRYEEQLTNRH
jgi:hypothetical protein